jgi:hypothetical protein
MNTDTDRITEIECDSTIGEIKDTMVLWGWMEKHVDFLESIMKGEMTEEYLKEQESESIFPFEDDYVKVRYQTKEDVAGVLYVGMRMIGKLLGVGEGMGLRESLEYGIEKGELVRL